MVYKLLSRTARMFGTAKCVCTLCIRWACTGDLCIGGLLMTWDGVEDDGRPSMLGTCRGEASKQIETRGLEVWGEQEGCRE